MTKKIYQQPQNRVVEFRSSRQLLAGSETKPGPNVQPPTVGGARESMDFEDGFDDYDY